MIKVVGIVLVVALARVPWVSGIEYKKNVISGTDGATQSTIRTFSSSFRFGGTNMTRVTSGSQPQEFHFRHFDWGNGHGRRKTLDERIREAEQRLYKLYFTRDILRTLEDEITIAFESKNIREVMEQVSEIKGVRIPFEVPEGTYMVEQSDVTGMPTDDFLRTVASISGLVLQYTPDKLVFVKAEP